jgi:uncharacterized membrane protein
VEKRVEMSQTCPISTKKVDANRHRLIALQATLIVGLLLITKSPLVAFWLAFEFWVRFFNRHQFSLTSMIATMSMKKLNLKNRLTDYAPKRFALILGLVVSTLIALSLSFGFTNFAMVLSFILLFCAGLEASYEYCVGCKLYYIGQWLAHKVS